MKGHEAELSQRLATEINEDYGKPTNISEKIWQRQRFKGGDISI